MTASPSGPAAEIVVLLHGIANVTLSMKYLEKRLHGEGFSVINLGYPSTNLSINGAAHLVRNQLTDLEPGARIHFVAHSLGNIVLRQMFSEPLPNLGRMVMIAPPNRGSLTAQQLKDLKIFRWIYGPAGQQLAADNNPFFEGLPKPPCEFGIIAGGKGDGEGFNPLLPGDDDGTVRVEETRLEGAADFILVRNVHTLILFDRKTAEQVVHFLRNGQFTPDADRPGESGD
jgi:hypothetical protein